VHEFGAAVADPTGVLGIAQWLPGAGTRVELGLGEAPFLATWAGQGGGGRPDYPAVQAAAAAIVATRCAELAGSVAPAALWAAAAALRTTTLFGGFGIDATTGLQVEHGTVLGRWTAAGLEPAGAPPTG